MDAALLEGVPNPPKVLGCPNIPVLGGFRCGVVERIELNVEACGLKAGCALGVLACFSGKKSASLESSCISSLSSLGAASTRPSRIARATLTPLITATRVRRHRFASTMWYEKACFVGVEDSTHASDVPVLVREWNNARSSIIFWLV